MLGTTNVIKHYMLKGYAINRNAVSEQKYEDLKKAMGLLENVFSKEFLLTSDQATDLFDVICDYTDVHYHNSSKKKYSLEIDNRFAT